MTKDCVVLLCNNAYFHKFLYTCNLLVTKGNYKGDICLVIGDDLVNSPLLHHELIVKHNIIVKHFPDIPFTENFLHIARNLKRDPRWFDRIFQYHKLHLFNTYFKQWDYIFYIDCGMNIFSDITPMLNSKEEYKFLAHSDAYPTYKWNLDNQFDKMHSTYTFLEKDFNLNVDYPQTTIMLYDTQIIEDNTYADLINLMNKYPFSVTNDQGVFALYFTNVKPCFQQIKTHDNETYYYDFLRRNKENKYNMVKLDIVL